MKVKINWKHFLLFFVVIGGIYLLTKSFWMTLGIVLILFVIDHFLKEYDERRRKNKENE
jgi:protein-S-isoprenylcysteine O-methyltransferase Ste14